MAEKISGYRELRQLDVDAINHIKDVERQVGELWSEIKEGHYADGRWMALAKTHLQEGFMAFVRAVAQPEDVFDGDR